MMRLALHIFRKDVERLWPAVLVTFALLALFVSLESGDTRETSFLNLLLPFAWCLLIGLVVQEDSPVGARPFWLVLPCGWRPMLIAKIAFIIATIEFPYFIATAAILGLRGFDPLAYLPHLMWKQLVLAALIVPALAVAAMAKNIGQVLLTLIAIASGVMFLSGEMNRQAIQHGPFDWDSRWILCVVILALGGLVAAAVQFISPRAGASRTIVLATALVASGLYHRMSRETSAAVTAALLPAAVRNVAVQIAPYNEGARIRRRYYNSTRTTALLPVQFSGLPEHGVRLDTVSLTMTRENGDTYEAQWLQSPTRIRAQRIFARLDKFGTQGRAWLAIELDSSPVANTLQSGPIAISGRVIVRLYRIGTQIHIADMSEAAMPAIGHCKTGRGTDPSQGEFVAKTLECESPVEDPLNITAVPDTLSARFTGGTGNGQRALYPQDPWLSPLYRNVRPFLAAANAAGWNVTPSTPDGYVLIDFTFPHLDLNQYIVQKPEKTEKTDGPR